MLFINFLFAVWRCIHLGVGFSSLSPVHLENNSSHFRIGSWDVCVGPCEWLKLERTLMLFLNATQNGTNNNCRLVAR